MSDEHDKRDFFISFTRADSDWATWVAWVLEQAGFLVLFQNWDFAGSFVLEMDRAHKETRRTIAILSPDYLKSEFCMAEWAARFKQDPTGKHDLLIPVRVKPCDPQGLLGPVIYADLVDVTREQARKRLLDRLRGRGRRPQMEPIFPRGPLPASERYFPVADDAALKEKIRARAYEIWEKQGRIGDELEPWLQAEREVKAERGNGAVGGLLVNLGTSVIPHVEEKVLELRGETAQRTELLERMTNRLEPIFKRLSFSESLAHLRSQAIVERDGPTPFQRPSSEGAGLPPQTRSSLRHLRRRCAAPIKHLWSRHCSTCVRIAPPRKPSR
jgi:hypothetical protein